jgi:serine/threonine-protein kinase
MSATAPSPRPFGPYVLIRALGSDALGEVWRAGTAGASRLKPFLLVRTFAAISIDRPALLAAMETAVHLVDDVQGPAIARGTVMGAIDDTPFMGISYVEGRTLDHLLAVRLLGTPLPVEHGLLIAERLLAALESGTPVERFTGAAHGFLVPAFVCISNEGEAKVFGHGLGAGLLPALRHPRARQTFAPYIAPEVLAAGKPSTSGDLFSVGAILFEALTGRPPSPGVALESVENANLAVDGTPVPEDLRRLLRRVLHPDPRVRDRNVPAFRRDLSALLYGGPYAPSTFNLAFFLQKCFDKAIQREKLELAAEEEIDPRTLAVPPGFAPSPDASGSSRRPAVEGSGSRRLPAPPARPPERTPRVASQPVPVRAVSGPMPKKALSGAPLWAVAGGAVLLLLVGAFFALRKAAPGPVPPPTPAPRSTPAPPAPVPTPAPVVVGKEDPLFQAAVEKKLQEEVKKRDVKSAREQEAATKKRMAEIDKSSEEAGKSKDSEETARAARDKADREEATRLAREAIAHRKSEAQQVEAATAAAAVKDGDLVEVDLADTHPVSVKQVSPQATRIAIQRRVSGTVLLRVLVDENGAPAKVEILRDTSPKVGLGDASKAALEQWRWKPATKDGHRVKTWIAVQVPFKN